jgi:hypothetical protein
VSLSLPPGSFGSPEAWLLVSPSPSFLISGTWRRNEELGCVKDKFVSPSVCVFGEEYGRCGTSAILSESPISDSAFVFPTVCGFCLLPSTVPGVESLPGKVHVMFKDKRAEEGISSVSVHSSIEPSVVVHTCNPSYSEAKVGGSLEPRSPRPAWVVAQNSEALPGCRQL